MPRLLTSRHLSLIIESHWGGFKLNPIAAPARMYLSLSWGNSIENVLLPFSLTTEILFAVERGNLI